MPAYVHSYRSAYQGPEYTGPPPPTVNRFTIAQNSDTGTVTDGNDDIWTVGETVTEDPGDSSFIGTDAVFIGTVEVNGTKYPVFYDNANGALSTYQVLFSGPNAAADQLFMATDPSFASFTPTSESFVACFAEGTAIATPDGEVAVETLKAGDRVLTADGKAVPVRWIGWSDLFPTPVTLQMQPVRIRAGALGAGVPNADLVLTSDHALLIDGMLINAGALVNGDSIDFLPLAESGNRLRVFHVETEAHEVILANGTPSESYLDNPTRAMFDNHAEYLDLYGAEPIIREMDLPRITSARLLPESIRARLGLSRPEPRFADLLSA